MYIPKNFLIEDDDEIIAFMQRFSFAMIISAKDNVPVGTHLPFLVSKRAEKIVLTSHFARANNHWENLDGLTNLIVFTEPHAYISPTNYESTLNVPTWNYISVHAYGTAKLLTAVEDTFNVLEATINNYEAGYKEQWDTMPEDYKIKLAKGIVAFEIEVTDLQAKKKLSQNKTIAEQKNIINTLSKADSNEQHIAEYMQQNIS